MFYLWENENMVVECYFIFLLLTCIFFNLLISLELIAV